MEMGFVPLAWGAVCYQVRPQQFLILVHAAMLQELFDENHQAPTFGREYAG
jgi:hypothetical protein